MSKLHIQAQMARGHLCHCGHGGREHAGNEPRVCKIISCNCDYFKSQNPYALHLSNIDRYVDKFKKWKEKFDYLCEIMPFLYAMNNTEIMWWYWKYVYPHYDPKEEFMTDEIETAILTSAKPEAITRGFRKHKETHREQQHQFENLVMWQSFNEAGYREAAIDSKI